MNTNRIPLIFITGYESPTSSNDDLDTQWEKDTRAIIAILETSISFADNDDNLSLYYSQLISWDQQ